MTEPEEKPPYKPNGKQLLCSAGRPVFEQGAPAHQVFYIEEGRVEVTVQEGPHTIRLAELGPGEIFGEMSVLSDELRSATVTALEATTITVITRKDLEERIAALDDEFVKSLITSLVRRLRDANKSQIRYFSDLAAFQDRMSGLMQKAHNGVNQEKRSAFAAEVKPLLDQIETLLDKYRQ